MVTMREICKLKMKAELLRAEGILRGSMGGRDERDICHELPGRGECPECVRGETILLCAI